MMYWKTVGPHRFKLNRIATFAGRFIYKDGSSEKYKVICEKHVDDFLRIVILIFSLIWIAHTLAVFGPFYAYFFQNIRITPLATNLPFFEKDSDLEFTISMILQGVLAFCSMAGNFAIEIGSCAIINTIRMIPDLIRFNLAEFTEKCEADGLCITSIARLRNVFVQIQDFDRYFTISVVFPIISFSCKFVIFFQIYDGCDRSLLCQIIRGSIFVIIFDKPVDLRPDHSINQ